ncbi:MAG TPA: sodium:proton antiporter, partial [Firmicutes bacterium]|nr:sodium:proton antiporter [Bacillota bacterium]
MNRKKLFLLLIGIILLIVVFAMPAFAQEVAEEGYQSNVHGTFLSLLPPILAIALALITKEVYSSLFIGVVSGALLYANFKPLTAYNIMFTEGFIASLADSWNVGILIFLVVLGAIVSL